MPFAQNVFGTNFKVGFLQFPSFDDVSILHDEIRLKGHWKVKGVNYYKIEIEDPEGGEHDFLFDENYTFLKYEGCHEKLIKKLTDKRKVNSKP